MKKVIKGWISGGRGVEDVSWLHKGEIILNNGFMFASKAAALRAFPQYTPYPFAITIEVDE